MLNIHDFCVSPNYRRRGLAIAMLMEIEQFARSQGYCKLTLEVLSENTPAKKVYERAGFGGYEFGIAEFWLKKLE